MGPNVYNGSTWTTHAFTSHADDEDMTGEGREEEHQYAAEEAEEEEDNEASLNKNNLH